MVLVQWVLLVTPIGVFALAIALADRGRRDRRGRLLSLGSLHARGDARALVVAASGGGGSLARFARAICRRR